MGKQKAATIDRHSRSDGPQSGLEHPSGPSALPATNRVRFNLGPSTLRVEPSGSANLRDNNVQCDLIGALDLDGKSYLIFKERTVEDTACTGAAGTCVADILTRRELQIAVLVSQGRVNKQIAYHLNLSEWTVSGYLRRIYAKLGVRTRAAMIARLANCALFDGKRTAQE